MLAFKKTQSFSGSIKKVVSSAPSEDLNRFYQVVSLCPLFFFLVFFFFLEMVNKSLREAVAINPLTINFFWVFRDQVNSSVESAEC